MMGLLWERFLTSEKELHFLQTNLFKYPYLKQTGSQMYSLNLNDMKNDENKIN